MIGQNSKSVLQTALRYSPDHDSSIFYLHVLLDVSEREHDDYHNFQAHYLLGKQYLLRLQTHPAKTHFTEAGRAAARMENPELEGFASDRLALAYLEEGIVDSALFYFQHSCAIYRQHHLEHRLWAPLQGISRVFKDRKDYVLAKKYGDEALASIEPDDGIAKSIVLNHMISLTRDFQNIHDYADYFDQYVEALEPIRSDTLHSHKIGFYSVTADPHIRLKEILSVIETLGPEPRISLLSSYYHLGVTYLELGEWERAAEAFKKGVDLNAATPSSVAFRHALYQGLITAYQSMNNFRDALYWFQQKVASEENVAYEVNSNLINELQVKYETAQKEQQILTQQLALERRTLQRNLILIVSVLLAIFLVVLFFFFRYRLHVQRTITAQQSRLQQQQILELENQNKLLSLTAMIAGQEEERKRLAKDIHDGLGGLLATVKMQFERLGELLREPDAMHEFNRSRNLLEETGNEVRRIAHNMIPHALMKMGLIPALEDLANTIQNASGLMVSLKCIDITSQMTDEKEVVVYRIAQELCNNVIKHAEASRLLIQLSQYNGTYALVVEDNGRGIDPDVQLEKGFGMESISSRVAYLNGSLDIDSTPGKGTSVTIEFPASHES